MEEQQTYRQEGLPFSFVVVLFEDALGNRPPDEEDDGAMTLAPDYAEVIGVDKEFPVTVDFTGELIDNVPWEEALPGKCVVSRDMVILHCWTSIYNEEGIEVIREDYAASR